jgi:hypothetical protein
MFGFLKKKPPPAAPYADKRWFITELFEKIRDTTDPNTRLEKYVDLCDRIADLEREFGCECLEVEFERDEISDTFQEATDTGVLFTCSLAYGLFQGQLDEITKIYLSDLPDHLKARLLHTHIESELGFEKIDPMEFRPEFQQAFYEVENRRLDDFEKSRVLKQEFGIRGWRTRREMNPDIIYEIPMPKRS